MLHGHNHDFKVILRFIYLRWLKRDDVLFMAEDTAVKSGKLPEEILLEDEIKKLAEAAYTSRRSGLFYPVFV